MQPVVARLAKRVLFGTGHYRRALSRDHLPGVAILCYPAIRDDGAPARSMDFEELHVRASELAAHCRFLRETCHPIRLDDLLEGPAALPPRPVLVSFDDGYRSVFLLAKPILERFEIPAVVFVTSGPVLAGCRFWYDAYAQTFGEEEVESAKALPHEEWRRRVEALESEPLSANDPHAPLTPGQVAELAEHPLFDVGGHSQWHPILSRAPVEVQRREIFESKAELEGLTGAPLKGFAYPNGRPGIDYGERTVELVREAGYETAFTTKHGFASGEENLWERSRFLMLSGVSKEELAHRLKYSWRPPGGAAS